MFRIQFLQTGGQLQEFVSQIFCDEVKGTRKTVGMRKSVNTGARLTLAGNKSEVNIE